MLLFLALSSSELPPNERSFDSEAIDQYRKNPEFNYEREYRGTNIFSILLAQLVDWINAFFRTPGGSWIGRNLIKLLVVAVLVTSIFLIIRIRYGAILVSGRSSMADDAGLPIEQGATVDYLELYEEAIRQDERKLALRYLYLSTLVKLQYLNQVKLIKWKTAHDYMSELSGEKVELFREFSEHFELAWYGNREPQKKELDRAIAVAKRLVDE